MTALFFSRSNNAVEDDDGEDYLKGLDVDDRGGRGNLCPDEGGFHTEESRLPAIIRSRGLVSSMKKNIHTAIIEAVYTTCVLPTDMVATFKS